MDRDKYHDDCNQEDKLVNGSSSDDCSSLSLNSKVASDNTLELLSMFYIFVKFHPMIIEDLNVKKYQQEQPQS